MAWPCVLYENREAARTAGGGRVRIGAVWPMEVWEDWMVSDEYRATHAGKRAPLVVQLPSGPFPVDGPQSGGTSGWQVTGEPPRLTLSPSVNVVGFYHGWIQDGVITDDCEGRTFPGPT
jgi:hypothetical protein